MWLDPRIQGQLRELLDAASAASKDNKHRALELHREAVAYAEKSGDEYEIAVASLSLATILLILGDYNEGYKLLDNLEGYCKQTQELKLLARVYYWRGQSNETLDNLEEAERDLLTSIELCEKLKSKDDVYVTSSMILSNVYTKQIRYSEAINIIFKARRALEERTPGTFTEERVYFCTILVSAQLGILLFYLQDYSGARRYFEEEAAAAMEAGRIQHASSAYSNIGLTYSYEGQDERAIEFYLKALEPIVHSPQIDLRIIILSYLGRSYRLIGELDKAEQVIEEAFLLSVQKGGNYWLWLILNEKGLVKLARKDAAGINYLLEALALSNKSKSESGVDEVLSDIADYYLSAGDYKKAAEYQQRLIQLNRKKGKEGNKLISSLEVAQREHEQALQEKDKEILRNKLEHQERELTLTTSQLASQVDLLSHFRNDLREIVRGIGDPIDALRNIKQKLKELPCEQIDWAKFEADFVSVHPEFRSLLAERFPNLTAQEVKMCLLVRLGLKNAEIARLTCLSERTVDNHRFNLRKKLGIKTEQNLTQFLATIK